ncbi:hypothetical protein K523DRAFT_357650 [Schizophyllum commune Tattone D]|nr:hypothetical protein K523DRAFT_357650 [Schizophyllum commune Tattone D]
MTSTSIVFERHDWVEFVCGVQPRFERLLLVFVALADRIPPRAIGMTPPLHIVNTRSVQLGEIMALRSLVLRRCFSRAFVALFISSPSTVFHATQVRHIAPMIASMESSMGYLTAP